MSPDLLEMASDLDAWTSERLDVWMSGCLDVWMCGCLDVWMSECLDVWMSRRLDVCRYMLSRVGCGSLVESGFLDSGNSITDVMTKSLALSGL